MFFKKYLSYRGFPKTTTLSTLIIWTSDAQTRRKCSSDDQGSGGLVHKKKRNVFILNSLDPDPSAQSSAGEDEGRPGQGAPLIQPRLQSRACTQLSKLSPRSNSPHLCISS